MEQTKSGQVAENKMISLGDLIKETLRIYQASVFKLVTLMLIPFLASLPLAGVAALFLFTFSQVNQTYIVAAKIILGILGFVLVLLSVYLGVSSQAAAILALKNWNRKIKDMFNDGRRLFWPFFGTSLLVGLFVVLWGLLLIIPGLIYAVYYAFSVYVLIFENLKFRAAMKRSYELVKDYWWAVVGRCLVFWLLLSIASGLLTAPLSFLPDSGWPFVVFNTISAAVRLILGPLYVIFPYLIYKDLVRIKSNDNGQNQVQN